MSNDVDFSPKNRAFTGGVGKPTKVRRNDGRPSVSAMGLSYGGSVQARPSHIFDKLAPYANNKPISRVVHRAPSELTPEERKRWHMLRKAKAA